MMVKLIAKFFVRFAIVSICFVLLMLFLYTSKFGSYSEKSIAILAWQNQLDKQYVSDFERETGIQVNINYIETNEEIFSKLLSTSNHGYDLVMPSDYFIPMLIKHKLIKKIDKSRLSFWDDMYPALLDHEFDPGNEYSIPYNWGIYGLGVNVDYFNGDLPEASWSLLFDKDKIPARIAVIDDMFVLVSMAMHYLYGQSKTMTREQMEEVKALLLKQKEWITAYTDLRIEYLLASKACPVVMAINSDIAKIMRHDSNIQFLVPKEGSFISIDLFAISQTSEKEEYVYEFLNYLYRPSILQQYVNKFEFFSPIKTVSLKNKDLNQELSIPSELLFKWVRFLSYDIPTEMCHDIWMALKA